MDLSGLVDTFTVIAWVIYTALILIGLPGMYESVHEFILDDDVGLALFAFCLPLFFCLGLGLFVYYLPLLSGFMMIYFVIHTLRGE